MMKRKLFMLIFIGIFIPKQNQVECNKQGQNFVENSHQIWEEFDAPDINGDQLTKYYIIDLPETKHKEAIHLLTEYFFKEMPLVVGSGMC